MKGIAAQLLWNAAKLNYNQLLEKLTDKFSERGIEINTRTSFVVRDVAKMSHLGNWHKMFNA